MDITDQLSYQELNSIFSMFAQLPSTVIWISSSDFSRQIYLNENFETMFQLERNVLFQDQSKFYDLLVPEDRVKTLNKNIMRVEGQFELAQDIYYRGMCHDKIIPIRDTYYPLVKNNQVTSFIGISQQLQIDEWQNLQEKSENPAKINDRAHCDISQALREVFQIEVLLDPPPVATMPKTYQLITKNGIAQLTPKEAECLQFLFNGVRTKVIASYMNISVRTVEAHLDHIRQKTRASTRIALMGSILNQAEITTWVFPPP